MTPAEFEALARDARPLQRIASLNHERKHPRGTTIVVSVAVPTARSRLLFDPKKWKIDAVVVDSGEPITPTSDSRIDLLGGREYVVTATNVSNGPCVFHAYLVYNPADRSAP